MVRQEKADLSSVKQLLTSFALDRSGDSTAQLEAEFGDLLLFMIHLLIILLIHQFQVQKFPFHVQHQMLDK